MIQATKKAPAEASALPFQNGTINVFKVQD